jgi:hypothetical protein
MEKDGTKSVTNVPFDPSILELEGKGLFEKVFDSTRNRNLVLQASVGQGKSIWITEFVKWMALNGRSVRFFDAKELDPRRLRKD